MAAPNHAKAILLDLRNADPDDVVAMDELHQSLDDELHDLATQADDAEGLHIHQLEYIEMDQVKDAARCMQKLRKLSKGVHSVSTEKRSHNVALECLSPQGLSPSGTKKARTLQAVPTDASLPE